MEWGEVHRITDNIVHLMRGNIYRLEGKDYLVFGGCKSSEGWKATGKWFPQEEACDEEYDLAYENLKKHLLILITIWQKLWILEVYKYYEKERSTLL